MRSRAGNVETRCQNVVHAVLLTLPRHCLVRRPASWRGLARDVGVVRQHHRYIHHNGWVVANYAHAHQVGAWRKSGGVGASFRPQQVRHRRHDAPGVRAPGRLSRAGASGFVDVIVAEGALRLVGAAPEGVVAKGV